MKIYKLKIGDLVVHKGFEKSKGFGLIIESDRDTDGATYIYKVLFRDRALWYTKTEIRLVHDLREFHATQ